MLDACPQSDLLQAFFIFLHTFLLFLHTFLRKSLILSQSLFHFLHFFKQRLHFLSADDFSFLAFLMTLRQRLSCRKRSLKSMRGRVALISLIVVDMYTPASAIDGASSSKVLMRWVPSADGISVWSATAEELTKSKEAKITTKKVVNFILARCRGNYWAFAFLEIMLRLEDGSDCGLWDFYTLRGADGYVHMLLCSCPQQCRLKVEPIEATDDGFLVLPTFVALSWIQCLAR